MKKFASACLTALVALCLSLPVLALAPDTGVNPFDTAVETSTPIDRVALIDTKNLLKAMTWQVSKTADPANAVLIRSDVQAPDIGNVYVATTPVDTGATMLLTHNTAGNMVTALAWTGKITQMTMPTGNVTVAVPDDGDQLLLRTDSNQTQASVLHDLENGALATSAIPITKTANV